ncbi:hypothetical protein [Thermolongibacillus altinsuensis]|nr:hypothetical protein [Thermolongibacillus altinsuensis]
MEKRSMSMEEVHAELEALFHALEQLEGKIKERTVMQIEEHCQTQQSSLQEVDDSLQKIEEKMDKRYKPLFVRAV